MGLPLWRCRWAFGLVREHLGCHFNADGRDVFLACWPAVAFSHLADGLQPYSNPLYSSRMNYVRRLFVGLLLLVLGAGAPMLTAQAGEMAQPVVSAVSHQTADSRCHDRGCGDMAMMTSACSLMSSCFQGVVAAPGPNVPVSGNLVFAYFAEQITGLSGSPEPFPPKASILA